MTRPAVTESELSPNGAVAQPVGGGPNSAGNTASAGGWALPLIVLITGMFMTIMDISIVNVAVPTIQNEFGVTTDDVQWIITAYTPALGVVVPATA